MAKPGRSAKRRKWSKCSGNVKVLAVTIMLFSAITVAQFFAAIAANSSTLLVDSFSMAVDTAAYMGNLAAECCGHRASGNRSKGPELAAAGFSMAVLFGVALWGMVDALESLEAPPGPEEQLDPALVMGFGVAGIVFDTLSLCAFHRWGGPATGEAKEGDLDEHALCEAENGAERRENGNMRGSMAALPPPLSRAGSGSPHIIVGVGKSGKVSMNMCSAVLHVGADFLRSITTTVEGAAVLWLGVKGHHADAIATAVVSATILAGSLSTIATGIVRAMSAKAGGKNAVARHRGQAPSGEVLAGLGRPAASRPQGLPEGQEGEGEVCLGGDDGGAPRSVELGRGSLARGKRLKSSERNGNTQEDSAGLIESSAAPDGVD